LFGKENVNTNQQGFLVFCRLPKGQTGFSTQHGEVHFCQAPSNQEGCIFADQSNATSKADSIFAETAFF